MPVDIHLLDGETFRATEDFQSVWDQIANDEVLSIHLADGDGQLKIPVIFITEFHELQK